MSRLMKIELRRALVSPSLWAALLVGLAIALLEYGSFAVPARFHLTAAGKELGMYPHSVFNKWLGASMSSYTPELYFLLLPLLATIPYGASFHTDLNSGLVKNLFLKTKKRHYFAAKYLAVFLSGAAAVLIPLLVNLALTAATLPSLMPEIGPRTFPVMTTDMWAGLFYTHPYAYLFAYLLLIALFSGFLPAISLCVSFYVKNRFAVLLSPFILCLFIHSVSQLLGNHSLDPITYLNPGAAYSSVPLILLELIPLAVVTFLLFMVKGCRDDTF